MSLQRDDSAPIVDSAAYTVESERYELFESACAAMAPPMTRRELLRLLSTGVLVFCAADGVCAQESGQRGRGRGGGAIPNNVSAWVHIGPDGAVTAFTGKTEVGQNARTSLSQAVSEELGVDPASVRLIMADTDLTPFDMGTFGSRTTPDMFPRIRRAAAAAREILIDLAAEEWKTGRDGLKAAGGRILNPTGQSIGFGSLTHGQKFTQTIRPDIELKPASAWAVCGKPHVKTNGRDIVTGAHRYSSDISRPGMVYGRALRPTAFGATLSAVDGADVGSVPGAQFIRDGDFVGVVAPDSHSAARALEAVRAQWKVQPQPRASQLNSLLAGAPAPRSVAIEEALGRSDVRHQADYTVAYVAHTPLEPRAAVAEWTGDKLTVWTGTQRPFGVRGELARTLDIPEARIRVIVPDTGSGYGGKHTGEAAVEAARLSRAAGKPVKVVWTREEEFTWAYFRPAGVIRVTSGAARDGALRAWDFHNYNSGGSAIRSPYECPAQNTQFHPARSPLRQGSYRGLAATANNFARETHLDELARQLQVDPLELRLRNLKDSRLRAVLESAAAKFGWGKARPAAGHGFGIACGAEKGGYVATCAEVAIEPKGRSVKLIRAVTAFECGAIVNPMQLQNQVEGAVIMGLGGALWEAVDFADGRILNPRLSRYRVPRFGDVPVLETVLLDRKDLPSAGAGESPIIAIAPAIGNALFSASGIRLRSLPLIPGGVLPAA